MKSFTCACGNALFFENYFCLQCQESVGFDPESLTMLTVGENTPLRRCANGVEQTVCNWLVGANDPNPFCLSCRNTPIIPDLSAPESLSLWAKMEAAKRRALYSLLSLGLPLQPLAMDGALGATNDQNEMVPLALSFRFLSPTPEAPVITGHSAGTITMNLEEANDWIRERNRLNLGEPYRTLLGHFRHEIGHYYWSMWFENDQKRDEVLPGYRALFGDERLSYEEAMKTYYANGANPAWQEHSISAYSTMHPWEDWAETWAHYLHVTEALETFESLGLRKSQVSKSMPLEVQLPPPFENYDPTALLAKLKTWMEVAPAINELSSSLGQNMLYPFVVSPDVVNKLLFIHCMIERQAVENGKLALNKQTEKAGAAIEVPSPGTSTTEVTETELPPAEAVGEAQAK